MTDTSSVVIDADQGFTRSAGKQLAIYALYALAGLAAIMYLLSVAAGSAGANATGNAIDVENNTIRGKIFLQPTRAVEFISLDFVVTNAGTDV